MQGCHVPKLLAAGTTLEGAVGFLTLSDCGEEVSDDSPLPQKLRIAMTEAVQAVHKHHVWHGDLHPRNFLHNRETDRVVLADFSVAQLLDGPHQALDDELAHFQRSLAWLPSTSRNVPACTAPDVLKHCPLASTPALDDFCSTCVSPSEVKSPSNF